VWEAPLSHAVDLQRAREAVRKAKRALRDAEFRFDTDCGPENSMALMNEVRTAERHLADAVSALNTAAEWRSPSPDGPSARPHRQA
jgi:hypothetical protein